MGPQTVNEMLETWDGGGIIQTLEMGGLGPGYEQAIQIGIVELCRACKDKPIPEKGGSLEEAYGDTLRKVSSEFELGLSGAQAGAIMQMAYFFLSEGPGPFLERMKEEGIEDSRFIMASNEWPGKPRES